MKMLKSVTLLRLKLEPSDEQVKWLEMASSTVRKAENRACIDWLLRQHGKPESGKQSKRTIVRKGADPNEPIKESTKIYHAACEAAPELDVQICAKIGQQIDSHLNTKLDWRRQVKGQPKLRRKDAILACEDRPPFRQSDTFDVPASNERVSLDGKFTVGVKVFKGHWEDIPVSTGSLPKPLKSMLHAAADGTKKLPGGKVVCKNGKWYLHVPFIEEKPALISDRTAELLPFIGIDGRPFVLKLPDRTWGVGDGRHLYSQACRYTMIEKQIGWRYRNSGRPDRKDGHGRQKIDKQMRRRKASFRSLFEQFRAKCIADIVRQCQKNGVGTVLYREPSLPVRDKCWFSANGLDWDWTQFLSYLTNGCRKNGIEVEVHELKMKEVLSEKKTA